MKVVKYVRISTLEKVIIPLWNERDVNMDTTNKSGGNNKANNSNSTVYIARQPIFSSSGKVYAYELLYRSSEQNKFDPESADNDSATGTIISESILTFGLSELTNGQKAFVNFAEGYLLNKASYLLNPEFFVIEILECVTFTVEVIDALYTLKASGFDLALDDYTGANISPEILSLIDIIKIDFQASTYEERAYFVPALKKAGKTLLAEKVETKEDVAEAMNLGCQLYQGYYFSKPVMLKKSRRDISSVSYLRLSKELASPTLDLDRIAWTIHWDAHLTYKLLKRMKTLQYYRGNTITSIKRALVMMGLEEVRRFLMLILIRGMLESKNDEIIRTALIRAFMCEKLSREAGCHKYSADAFSTGLLSILVYGNEYSMELFSDIAIPPQIKAALSGSNNILRELLDIALYYENGEWTGLENHMFETVPKVSPRIMPGLYLLSVAAADEILKKDEGLSPYNFT